MAWTRSLLVLVVASCTTYGPSPALVRPPCRPITVRVVDEGGRPVAGASVRTIATYRQFGPSGLPEASHMETDESPLVKTDARGNASVCQVMPDHDGSIVVEHLDWPRASVPAYRREVTIGRARAAVVQVPVAEPCNRGDLVRVTAYGEAATSVVRGTSGPLHHFTLAGLGPWRYWVRSEACGETVVRSLDGRALPAVLTMDRNESVVEYRELAGGTATVTAFRETDPLVTATLSAEGVATLTLPGGSGGTYCVMLQKDDRCLVTYARVGEVARPGMYLDRGDMLARDCRPCP